MREAVRDREGQAQAGRWGRELMFHKHLLCAGTGPRSFPCTVSVSPETNLHLLASFYRGAK